MQKLLIKRLAMLCLICLSLCFAFGCDKGNGSVDVDVTPNEFFSFNLLDDDTYEIGFNYGGEWDSIDEIPTELVLPSSYNNKAVTAISEGGFEGYYTLTSVVIHDSIT